MSATPQTEQSIVKTSPLIIELATEWKMTAATMIDTLKATVFPQKNRDGSPVVVSQGQLISFLQVCNEFKLNPFVKEIYAFPTKGGGIVPMVPIDGWANIVNRNEKMDGVQFKDEWEVDKTSGQRNLFSTTCTIYRKDRAHPIQITEYMQECYQPDKDPWKKWPARMLRHKAFIQCARIAFSLAGIYDPDEAERIADSTVDAKPEVHRPTRASETVIEGKVKDSGGEPVFPEGHDAGQPQKEAGVSSGLAASQAPASANCACTCCKSGQCTCIMAEDFQRCGCKQCVANVQSAASGTLQPSGTELFPEPGKESPAPEGPFVPRNKLGKLFVAAASAGIKVVKDSQDDELHKVLKEKFGIKSLKEIPQVKFNDVLQAIAPNLKVAK